MSATVCDERGSWSSLHAMSILAGHHDSNVRLSPGSDSAARGSVDDAGASLESDDPLYATVRADVEVRLRPVCAGMPPELFADLVHGICSRKVRWIREDAERRRAD